MEHPQKSIFVTSTGSNLVLAIGLAAFGVAVAVAGIYVGEKDDAPGAALIGIVLMIGAFVLGWKVAARRKVVPNEKTG